jgi:hypothetical protein
MKCRNIAEKILNIDTGNLIVNFTQHEIDFVESIDSDDYTKICKHLRSDYFYSSCMSIIGIIKKFKGNHPNNTMYFKVNEYMESQLDILDNTYHIDAYATLVHISPTNDILLGTMTWLSGLQKQYDVNMLYVLEFIGENGVETTIKYKAIII